MNELNWRVNTPQLLQEILTNHKMAILSKPLTLFGRLLAEVGESSRIK